jgi:hypothetical protein
MNGFFAGKTCHDCAAPVRWVYTANKGPVLVDDAGKPHPGTGCEEDRPARAEKEEPE